MSYTIQAIEDHLTGMGHGSTLNKVRNKYSLYERVAAKIMLQIRPIETRTKQPLSASIHDEDYEYSLPSNFGGLIDLGPQANRTTSDKARRYLGEAFDTEKALSEKKIQITARGGTKKLKVAWKNDPPVTFSSMDSLTDDGAWSAVGTASGLELDELYKLTGNGAIKFDVAATGDGIQNTGITALDLTDEDENADLFADLYIDTAAKVALMNSITPIWGNNLTTTFWTGVAQTTQSDGTAWQLGWNRIRCPWSTATETGTVAPATIDSLKFTFNIDAAISNLRIDNVVFSMGAIFDIEFYSKYLFQTSAGAWISIPTSADDVVMIDNDSLPMFLNECLIAMAQQMEGEDSGFDIKFAQGELYDPVAGQYAKYKLSYPSEEVKPKQKWY